MESSSGTSGRGDRQILRKREGMQEGGGDVWEKLWRQCGRISVRDKGIPGRESIIRSVTFLGTI